MNNDNLNLLVKKAIKKEGDPIPKPFSPKDYLEGKINPFTCKHEIYLKYGNLHVCAVCGYSLLYNEKLPNSIELTTYREGYLFIKSLLNLISTTYISEEQIDLVNIFKKLSPSVNQILDILSNPKVIKDDNHLFPVGNNDSEVIADLIKNFKYNPNKTQEILREYENLSESHDAPVKIKKK